MTGPQRDIPARDMLEARVAELRGQTAPDLAALSEAAGRTSEPWRAMTTGVRGGDHWYVIAEGQAAAMIASNDGEDEPLREPTALFIVALVNAWREGRLVEVGAVETHNDTPVTAEGLRWAATHESLARSWIFDVLTGLADQMDGADQ